MGGHIPTSSFLMMAIFLHYNQQPAWAKKYAQQVITRADTEDIHVSAVARAREILAS